MNPAPSAGFIRFRGLSEWTHRVSPLPPGEGGGRSPRGEGAKDAQRLAPEPHPNPSPGGEGNGPRAGCFWLESSRGFPNQWRSDSTCWLGGGQPECRSLIRKTCVIAAARRYEISE